jgi:nitrogen fixation protein FixH
MNRTLTLALGALFAVAPVAAPAADSMKGMVMPQKLVVSAALNPAPPKAGMETITITVKDAMGKPVKGAAVKVATNMPTMSMTGPTLTAKDAGNGTYVAKTNLNFATTWTFDVTASSGSQKGTTQLRADVK